VFLLETLDVKFSGLVGQLYSDHVVSAAERDDIMAETTSFRANEKLLSALSRKSPPQFQLFLRTLDNCGQRHVRNVITDRPGLSIMSSVRLSVPRSVYDAVHCGKTIGLLTSYSKVSGQVNRKCPPRNTMILHLYALTLPTLKMSTPAITMLRMHGYSKQQQSGHTAKMSEQTKSTISSVISILNNSCTSL